MHTTRSLLILLVIAFVLGGAVLLWQRDHRQTPAAIDTVVNEAPAESVLTRLSRTTIDVPDINTLVTLTDGQGRFPIADASAEGTVSLSDIYAERLVAAVGSSPKRHDVLAIISVNSGGTGHFSYLILFEDSGTRLIQKSWRFLGDRIGIDSIAIHESGVAAEDYTAAIGIRERASGEPMAADPTVKKVIEIPVVKGTFPAEKKK